MLLSVLVFYFIGVLVSIFGITCSSVEGVLVIMAVSIAVFVELTKEKPEYAGILCAGYLWRVALLIWDIFARNIYALPNSGADSNMYHRTAEQIASGIVAGNGNVYSQIVATVYKLYGPAQILGQYLNVLLGVWVIILSIRCFEKIGIHEYDTAVKLEALLPNIAIMNCILLRETPIMFLLALSLYTFLCWMKGGSVVLIPISFIIVFFAAAIHSGAIAPALAYIFVLLFYDREMESYSLKGSTIIIAVVLLGAFMVVSARYGDEIFAKFQGATIGGLVDGQSSADGDSGYVVGVNTGNPIVSFILSTPIRMLYFLLSPFPWQWRGLSDIIAFVFSSGFYAICCVRAFQGLKTMKDLDFKKAVLIFTMFLAASSCLIFGWGVSNVGTAIRHRDKFLVQFAVMFAVGRSVLFSEEKNNCDPEYSGSDPKCRKGFYR